MAVNSDIEWNVDYGLYTDVGRVRQRNEDTAKVSPEISLYAVADGMGGHRAGDRASRIAVQALHEYLSESEGETTEEALRGGFRAANRGIVEDASERPDRLGMGTTLTALVLVDGDYVIGHVGDSRALRVRNGSVEQLTDDHSIVAVQVREGGMTEEEAKNHPGGRRGSVAWRSHGGVQPPVRNGRRVVPFRGGDRLCGSQQLPER